MTPELAKERIETVRNCARRMIKVSFLPEQHCLTIEQWQTVHALCDEVERLQEKNGFLEQIRSAQGERLVKMNAELAAYRKIGEVPLVRGVVTAASDAVCDRAEAYGPSFQEDVPTFFSPVVKAVLALEEKAPRLFTLSAKDAQTLLAIMKRYMPEEPR